MPRPASPGPSPARCAVGAQPAGGRTAPGHRPDELWQTGLLRAWSARLRHTGELQASLGRMLLAGCDDAGLVGPTGDALHELGRRLSTEAATAAEAAFDAAAELDRAAVRIMLAEPADGGVPAASTGRR